MKSKNNLKKIKTIHGDLSLPVFLPDATRGFIKSCESRELVQAGISALVVNTFHLYLQPGTKVIKRAGGIHKFINWNQPIVSDSGGFQIFSLIHQNSKMGKVTDDGAIFKSPLDGSRHEISPEKSIQIQFELGGDFIVCLDDCPPHGIDPLKNLSSVERTINWARRSYQEYIRQIKKRKIDHESRSKLVAVIQGGLDKDLRKKCFYALEEISHTKFLGECLPFPVYGFGGRPVDEVGKFLFDILDYTAKLIPPDRLKFALGIGSPSDIYHCYKMGWNIFDCVIPSREGRHGKLYQFFKQEEIKSSRFYKEINIKKSIYSNNLNKINPESKIEELKSGSWAYLHHLFKFNEALGQKWATLNNLEFYSDLMKKIN